MKRAMWATGVVAVSALVPIGAVTAAGSSYKYERSSAGANAIFTTCSGALVPGAHCEAWVVNADKSKGTDGKQSMVTVTIYDVEILDGGFNPVYRGSGSAEGSISVDSKLGKASAKATVPVVVDCTEDGFCTEMSVVVSAQWVAAAGLVKHSETSDDDDGTCKTSRSYKSLNRAATATGTVDGTSYTATNVVQPPQIFSTQESYKANGCDGPVFTPQAALEATVPVFQIG